EQYLRNGTAKFLLKRAMAGRLPDMILKERRKGLVGADWHRRVAPYRERFAESLARMEGSETARRLLDLERMRKLVDNWPKDDWHTAKVMMDYRSALCNGISAGQFIIWLEGGCQ
ncbi:MAG TPA: asparagine synthase-related protein, partial [Geobacteraceae bacterium]